MNLTTIIAAGMKEWSPGDWAIFFTAAAGFLTITVGPFIAKILADVKSLKTQNAGQQTQIDDVKKDVRNVTSAAMTPTTPATPTVEQIADAVKRSNP